MTKNEVPLDVMQRAVARSAASRADAPSDGGDPPVGLHPEIISAATAAEPDPDKLAALCSRENLGGRMVAELLLAVAAAHREYAPLAAELPQLQKKSREAAERLAGIRGFRPTTVEEAASRSELIGDAESLWTKVVRLKGEAQRAHGIVTFLQTAFPALFGLEPQPGGTIRGIAPPAVQRWFHDHRLDAYTFGSWRQVGRPNEPPRRRFLRPAIPGVNTPKP